MTLSGRVIDRSPDEVWRVISDGWLHPLWMVGATATRDVDDAWPAQGSRIRHETGFWPVAVNETTQVLEAEPPQRIRFRVTSRLLGEAEITLALEPVDGGCRVTIDRRLNMGPRMLIPRSLRRRILQPWGAETLTRLGFLAEGRREKVGAGSA